MISTQQRKQNESKPITMKDLGQFTEQIIFPGVERIIDDRVEKIVDAKIEMAKEEIINEVSKKIIESNDKVVTKLDILLKENAAHTMGHHRIDDTLHGHDKRIKKLEETHHRSLQ